MQQKNGNIFANNKPQGLRFHICFLFTNTVRGGADLGRAESVPAAGGGALRRHRGSGQQKGGGILKSEGARFLTPRSYK